MHALTKKKRRRRAFAKAPDGAACGVAGCIRKYLAKGMCRYHYSRSWKYGDATVPPQRGPKGSGSTNTGGYRVITVDGRQVLEHRHIMEQHLGRPLRREENVHHKNGVRDDNRLDNLELWSKSQPAGQRVEDKVAWAREMIRLYGDLFKDAA